MKSVIDKISEFLKKYKYVAIVLLIGIVLLLWPEREEREVIEEVQAQDDSVYAQKIEERLNLMLSQINGAGRVEVMLTLQSGTRLEYQMDTQTDIDGDRSSVERKTVILSEGSAYDEAAVSEVQYPQFQGALVICEGADSAAVKLDLLNAVSALTGLRSDQITVVKMK